MTFDEHLKRASDEVATWPVWKQELLGGTAKEQATMMKQQQYIVLVGTPQTGFKVYGPFEDFGATAGWAADKNLDIDEWWAMPLIAPKQEAGDE